MNWDGWLTALLVMLALAGCAPVVAVPGQAPNAHYQQGDPRDTGGMCISRLAGLPAYLNARATAGFTVNLLRPYRPPGEQCLLSAASPRSSPPMWRGIRA
jgi:hypothetical protein